jgi:hypothetical protein
MSIAIKDSRIHGKGVFANQDFKKGEIVLRWDSLLGEDYLTKEIAVNSASAFINHSCTANINEVEGKNIALREIKKGEEITYDYENENIPLLKMECNCRSENCKRIIYGETIKKSF